MSIQLNQEYINTKNYKALSESDFFQDFAESDGNWKNYTLTKDVVLNFFWTSMDIINTLRKNRELGFKVPLLSEFLKNLNYLIMNNQLKVGVEGWKKYVDTLEYVALRSVRRAVPLFEVSNKDSDFIRLLFDEKYFSKIMKMVRQRGKDDDTGINFLSEYQIEGLSKDEMKKIPEVISYDSHYNYSCYPLDLWLGCFDSPVEAVKNIFNDKSNSIDSGSMLRKFSKDEYFSIVDSVKDMDSGKDSFKEDYCDILNYFRFHKDTEVPESIIQKIKELGNYKEVGFRNIIKNMSTDQLETNGKDIAIRIMVLSPKVDLTQAVKMTDISNHSFLTNVKGFTEKEILDNPVFFDIGKLQGFPSQYITKETWDKLCETKGMRVMYNHDLTNFNTILKNLMISGITIDYVKYLKDKTHASNKDFLRWIKESYIPDDSAEFKNYIKARYFLQKFTG